MPIQAGHGIPQMRHHPSTALPRALACSHLCQLPCQLPVATAHPSLHSTPPFLAVISVNSLNSTSGCWSWWDDCYDVRDLVKDWLKQNG